MEDDRGREKEDRSWEISPSLTAFRSNIGVGRRDGSGDSGSTRGRLAFTGLDLAKFIYQRDNGSAPIQPRDLEFLD